MTKQEWINLKVGDIVTDGCVNERVLGFKQTEDSLTHQEHVKTDNYVVLTDKSIPFMEDQDVGVDDLGKWRLLFHDPKEFIVDVSLHFDGYVKVIAQDKEGAEKYVKENFAGMLDSCGKESDDILLGWEVSMKSDETVVKKVSGSAV